MNLILELALLGISFLLVVHARRTYSSYFVFRWWGSGLFFGAILQGTLVVLAGLYSTTGFLAQWGGFDLVLILLWPNLAYISLMWADNLLGTHYLDAQSVALHQPIIFLIAACFGLSLETLMAQLGIITWRVDSYRMAWLDLPMLMFFMYGFSVNILIHNQKMTGGANQVLSPKVWVNLLTRQGLGVVALMGILLLTNSLIILFFS